MGNLAIIPARGGSKRIPRKNIKNFLGKSIIAYSIETALESALFDRIIVSTDDAEIAKIATSYGAEVPFFRSKENSDDFATTMDVLREVETCYKEKFNAVFDFICCIYPTAPLIKPEQLIEGLNLIVKNKLDTVFPVVEFSHPIWRGFEILNEKTKMLCPQYQDSRSQDLKKVYHDAGQWYWYNPRKIKNSLFTDNTMSVIVSGLEAQDIDNISDWSIAEIKYKILNEG